MSQNNNKNNLKFFFIKLISIIFGIIIVINISYNLLLAEKIESLSNKENIEIVKNKIRSEIKSGLNKDKILNEEDKQLILKFYLKIKNELNAAK